MLEWIEDLRAPWPAVTDQGQRPTCLSIALTTAHEHAIEESLSAEYLHWASGLHPGGRGNPQAAARAMLTQGQPPLEQWPYRVDADDADPSYGPDSALIGPFAKRRAERSLFDMNEVVQELAQGRWAILCLRVTDAFAATGAGIVLADGHGRAGHAVLAVGALTVRGRGLEPALRDGDRLLCVRNSWGPDWGADGHKLISEAALNECAILSLALDEVEA